jgi:hypothetical protein
MIIIALKIEILLLCIKILLDIELSFFSDWTIHSLIALIDTCLGSKGPKKRIILGLHLYIYQVSLLFLIHKGSAPIQFFNGMQILHIKNLNILIIVLLHNISEIVSYLFKYNPDFLFNSDL